MTEKINRANSSRKRLLLLALSTAIILAIYFLMPGGDQTVDYRHALFGEFYKPMPNMIDPVSKANVLEINNGYQAYEMGQYKRSIGHFEEKNPMNFTERLYCGLYYLALENGKRAIELLGVLKTQSNPNFRDQVDWYYALALLQDGQFEKTISNLEEIMMDQNHTYYAKAEDLFNDLH